MSYDRFTNDYSAQKPAPPTFGHSQQKFPHPADPVNNPAPDDEAPVLNDVDSVKRGIIKTSQNSVHSPFNILLVGETGVGKSSVLEFLGNVLAGRTVDNYQFNIIDHNNEAGGSQSRSQTNSAKVYQFTSRNGIVVRILDTPGLADTRGLAQDELHKKNIADEIRKNVEYVNAVLILANGTVPRLTVSTDYALTTLSSIFPKTLADNIAFLFTNVPGPLGWNFAAESLPPVLRSAPQLLLNNPLSLQKRYVSMNVASKPKKQVLHMRKEIANSEGDALEMLVEFFDWMDERPVQPTGPILQLYEQSEAIENKINDALAQIDQAEAKRRDCNRYRSEILQDKAGMDTYSNFERTVTSMVWKREDTTKHNTICNKASCYSNCHMGCGLTFTLDRSKLRKCSAIRKSPGGNSCTKCGHARDDHSHFNSKWVKVADTQVSRDSSMKARYEAAKSGKEQKEVLLSGIERAVRDLDASITSKTMDLAKLAADYAGLALSGGFSAQVEKALARLEQKFQSMQESGVADRTELQKMEASITGLKKKLDLLKQAARANAARSAGRG